ncbi:MAG TPA: hypothetical protein VMK13_15850 [Streptosporangiaceae bacterium]|nr:hypothetical protein [Streptosporangiaceae bacterium]
MIEICVAAAGLAAGFMIGVIAVVALGVRREERRFSLLTGTKSRVAQGARHVTGFSTRFPELARQDRRSGRPAEPPIHSRLPGS